MNTPINEQIVELQMLRGIARMYVPRKSDVTNYISKFRGIAHRTTVLCECGHRHNVRQGAVLIDEYGLVYAYVIRCRSCFNKNGGCDGTI
jgi:hypothetical protein